MATALNPANLPKFIKCTEAKYIALSSKDENAIYYLTDRNVFYVGGKEYSFDLIKSTSDPSGTGKTGAIYYNSTNKTAFVWDGTAFLKLSVAQLTDISGSVDDTTVPTSKAAKDYVDARETSILAAVAAGYEPVESGKHLSTNDFTDAFKAQLETYPEDYETVSDLIDTKVDKFSAVTNSVLIAGDSDDIIDSGVTVGGSALQTSASNTVLATEKAVADADANVLQDAKDYTDDQISALGSVFNFKGTKSTMAELNSVSGMVVGDVWHVTTGANGSSAEYVYTGSVWEELGTTLDLSGYATKESTANAGKIAQIGTDGDLKSSGKSFGGATLASTPSADTVASEAAVKAYTDNAVATGDAAKLDKLTGATNGDILIVASTGAAVQDSGKKIGGATLAASPDSNTIATEAAVKAYADAVAEEAAGAYLPFVDSGVATHLPLIGANGETLTDSGKTIATTITDVDTTIPTSKAVKTYADTKITKVTSPVAGNLVKQDANGELVDAAMTAGTSTTSFAAAPSSTNLPNEQAIVATVQGIVDALAWQTL